MGRTRITMKGILLSLMLVCASALELEDIANVNRGSEVNGRKPKLFFVSSSSTVTTIQTSTFCYATVSPAPAPITTCSRKRGRSIINEAMDIVDPRYLVEPSSVESSIESDDSLNARHGRFLQYWLTTTFTSTWYTKTVSIVSVYCTPAGGREC